MSKRFWILGIVLAGLVVVAMACDDDEKTTAELEAQACSDLAAFALSLEEVQTVLQNPSATVGEARDALDTAGSARDDAKSSVEKVEEARFADVESTYDSLASTINDVPDDASLQQGAATLRASADAVRLAVDSLDDELCGDGRPDATDTPLPEPVDPTEAVPEPTEAAPDPTEEVVPTATEAA